MKKIFVKPLALLLCVTMLLGGVGATVYAVNFDKKAEQKEVVKETEILKETEVPKDKDKQNMSKDETVYVIAQSNGAVNKIIVSDWIKNTLGNATISDKSALTDVDNVKGDETYTINNDNVCVWDAKGNDIYYQGNIEKELPVDISVSYKLDGKSISPEELAGKSGQVKIRFDYKNNQYEMVDVDGKQEKIYVPFVMLTGMLLDNSVFNNVDVSNGKLINDGNNIAVVGIAFPGLQSNLNINKEKLEIPDYVEITADVENFEMMNTVTVATNEISEDMDTKKLNTAEDLNKSLTKLTDSMNQLMDGSSKLYDGLCTLLNKSNELVKGINSLADGATKLKAGVGDVANGTSELAEGTKTLADGLNKLASNNATLNDGSKQVFYSLLSAADTQLAAAGLNIPKLTIENYSMVLNDVIYSLDGTNVASKAEATARQTVTDMVNAKKDTIKEQVTLAVKSEVTLKVTPKVRLGVESKVLEAMGMTKEVYDAGVLAGTVTAEQQGQVNSAIDAQMNSDAVKAIITSNIDQQMKSAEIQALISSKTEEQVSILIKQNLNSPEVQQKITAALEKAKSGASSISSLKTQLDSYSTFYYGLQQYTNGVADAKSGSDKLYSGANKLKAGTTELHTGADKLCDGILTLKDGAPALISGVTELRDGAMKLSNGLKEFNEKGVQNIINAVDGDLNGLISRINATTDVSKNYKSFSGISDDMDGKVKFIYRTESIKAE